jgi:hypothetical protein
MEDLEVAARLARLWKTRRWRRLEIYMPGDQPGGYCVTAGHRQLETADTLADPDIAELAEIRQACGWQRIEMCGEPGRQFGGWCERADGQGFNLAGLEET